jgi:Amt family ammonium transporter
VHGLSGIAGALLTAVLTSPSLGGQGLPLGQDLFSQLGIQLIAITSVVIWSATLSQGILTLIDKTIGLRVTPDEETEGLDLASHQSQAYHLSDSR